MLNPFVSLDRIKVVMAGVVWSMATLACASHPASPLATPSTSQGALPAQQGASSGKCVTADWARGSADGRIGQALPDGSEPHGSLPKDLIRQVVHRHVDEARSCYQANLGFFHRPQGRVVTRFVIAPSGRVISACAIHSTLGDPATEDCLLEKILDWGFPEPLGGGRVFVSYPFNFTTD